MPSPITVSGMTAIAVESATGRKGRFRPVPCRPGAAWTEKTPKAELRPGTNRDIKSWELHSELVLVCPEVYERARELLPERDPNAFLDRPREPVLLAAGMVDEPQHPTSLPAAVVGYALWRLIETARAALSVLAGVVMLTLLAEVLH
jgi:hypothetical protein